MESIFNLKTVADVLNGELIDADAAQSVTSVSTDTRTIEKGALFFALNGENSDGHKYIKTAVEKGAVCCVAEKGFACSEKLPLIKVENTSQALLDLAAEYRNQMKIPIVAVTGSVGKTSTRSMIGCVLSQKYNTLVTEGNFNNEIGVPHTLFKLNKNHDMAVIEMGMNHFGELSRITAAVKPDTVVITNIGLAHIENLGSRSGILKAKLESLEGLSEGGTVILNGDDDMLWSINGTLDFETLYSGIDNEKCDLTATNIRTYAENTEFTFSCDGTDYNAEISVPGRHHVYNALTSVLVGMKYNVPMAGILNGIKEFIPVGLRQAAVKIGKYTVIKDCYNANPTSMKSGLDILKLSKSGKRKIACLGDMLELGTISEKEHLNTGKLVPNYCVDRLITVGEKAKLIAKGAIEAGMDEKDVFVFDTNADVCRELPNILEENDVILLKASRSMHLEEISDFMEENMQ